MCRVKIALGFVIDPLLQGRLDFCRIALAEESADLFGPVCESGFEGVFLGDDLFTWVAACSNKKSHRMNEPGNFLRA